MGVFEKAALKALLQNDAVREHFMRLTGLAVAKHTQVLDPEKHYLLVLPESGQGQAEQIAAAIREHGGPAAKNTVILFADDLKLIEW